MGIKNIVCISDMHGQIKGLTVPECDLLLIAGDVSNCGKRIYEDANWLALHFNQWLKQQPAKHIVMVPGNHDVIFDYALSTVPKLDCHILIDKLVEIEGLKIYGSPWSKDFYNWGFNLPEKKLKLAWDKIPEGIDILLVHSPPYGIFDMTQNLRYEKKRIGSPSLLKKIKEIRPKYVVFGHNHGQPGVVEKDGIVFINATVLDDSRTGEIVNPPTVIEVDKDFACKCLKKPI